MKKNIFVISTILLGIVVVALLFTIATLQSENSDLHNKLFKLVKWTDDPVYKALDRSNTKIQVNMNK